MGPLCNWSKVDVEKKARAVRFQYLSIFSPHLFDSLLMQILSEKSDQLHIIKCLCVNMNQTCGSTQSGSN